MFLPTNQLKKSALLTLAGLVLLAGPALAQYASNGFEATTLRTPLIPGAPWSPDNMPAPLGQPEIPGDGDIPLPVTPGMLGGPLPPPTMVPMPPVGAGDKGTVNSYAAPYLTPPPSTPGTDPGMINPDSAGYYPPAAIVNVQQQGGLPDGSAPITKWNGQTTRDLGMSKVGQGSLTTDFGQLPATLPSVQSSGITPSNSQDGPRQATYPGQVGATTNRQPNLAGAQATTDLYGNRTLFKGANLRAQMTIAPY